MIDLDHGPLLPSVKEVCYDRKPTRNYSLSVVAASVAVLAILTLLIVAALKVA